MLGVNICKTSVVPQFRILNLRKNVEEVEGEPEEIKENNQRPRKLVLVKDFKKLG